MKDSCGDECFVLLLLELFCRKQFGFRGSDAEPNLMKFSHCGLLLPFGSSIHCWLENKTQRLCLEVIVVYVAGLTFLVLSVISLKDTSCERKFNLSGFKG